MGNTSDAKDANMAVRSKVKDQTGKVIFLLVHRLYIGYLHSNHSLFTQINALSEDIKRALTQFAN